MCAEFRCGVRVGAGRGGAARLGPACLIRVTLEASGARVCAQRGQALRGGRVGVAVGTTTQRFGRESRGPLHALHLITDTDSGGSGSGYERSIGARMGERIKGRGGAGPQAHKRDQLSQARLAQADPLHVVHQRQRRQSDLQAATDSDSHRERAGRGVGGWGRGGICCG
jgi:hypothetical protein